MPWAEYMPHWTKQLSNCCSTQSRTSRHRERQCDQTACPLLFVQRPHCDYGAGPTADTRQDRDVLLAAVLVSRHVADDAGGSLELVELLTGLGIDSLEVTFERSIKH